jgi:crossover junction endodeoxyribonuclease RusA
MSEISLTLPVPPSANRYWATNRKGRVYETDEAKEYKQAVCNLVHPAAPYTCEVCINFTVYRPRKSGDLDNYQKIMFDALQGLAFQNDSQVVEIHGFRKDDAKNPRVEILIYPSEGHE